MQSNGNTGGTSPQNRTISSALQQLRADASREVSSGRRHRYVGKVIYLPQHPEHFTKIDRFWDDMMGLKLNNTQLVAVICGFANAISEYRKNDPESANAKRGHIVRRIAVWADKTSSSTAPFNPQQRLRIEQALRTLNINPDHQHHILTSLSSALAARPT